MAIPSVLDLICGVFCCLCFVETANGGLPFTGTNQAGAEFGWTSDGVPNNLPMVLDTDYFYPTLDSVDYFMGQYGMNTFRFCVRWEIFQPVLQQDFVTEEIERMDTFINGILERKGYVIIDPHNYIRYNIGYPSSSNPEYIDQTQSGVTEADFIDLWVRLAERYGSTTDKNHGVIFGLMNEPKTDLSSTDWAAVASSTVAAIRSAGYKNLILVPGIRWTGAHSWSQDWGNVGPSNAEALENFSDPDDNWAFELHQYFDSDSSGTNAVCSGSNEGDAASQAVDRLNAFTSWAGPLGKRGFLGEFAGADNALCRSAIEAALGHLEDNPDVWIGWTWWAAGPQWGSYMYSVEPNNLPNPGPQDEKPQMEWLAPYANATSVPSNGPGAGDGGDGDGAARTKAIWM